MSKADGNRLARALRRIETLIEALDAPADPGARGPPRELLEIVLDLHALALARMTAVVAAADGGGALLRRLAEDEQVRAVLLLHGLHPDEMEIRVRRAVEGLRPQLARRGLRLEMVQANAATARLRVRPHERIDGRIDAAGLRQEIEAAIVEAAPDLDEIAIEGLDQVVAEDIAEVAG